MKCPETTEDGRPCIKATMQFPEGDWDHAGGHVFADARAEEILKRGHYDALAIIKGEQAEAHLPEECPDPSKCELAKREDI